MIKKAIKYITIFIAVVFIGNIIYFSTKRPNTALIEIEGIITPSKTNKWIKEIKNAENDKQLKAILIKIDSGGGEAVSSQRLYKTIKEASKKKFTVALITDIGASGAYYAACGANKIVSYPASIVGSIGVIFETINFSKLAKKIGVSLFVVKSGKVKDVGNPFRKPTKADRKMLQNLINNVYNQFLKAVSSSRKIPIKKLKPIANGSVFSGQEALKLKLIDSIGGMKEVKKMIEKKTDIDKIVFKTFQNHQNALSKIFSETLNYISLLSKPSIKTVLY